MSVGDRIKKRRKELGFSAEEVAKRVGVSPATIYRYESDDIQNMGIDKLVPIAKALHTTEAYLLGVIKDPNPIWKEEDVIEIWDEQPTGQPADNPKLAVLFKRSRALTDKQLDLVNSIIEEMAKEQE